MTEPQVITRNDNPNNPTPCRFVRTLPRCSQQLLSYESGGRYPALPAAQSMTTPMLATTTPMLATNNYYQARPDCVEAKKNRPRTPKRPRPDTARRPQGLQEIRKEQRRESADFDQNQKTIKFKIGHRIPRGLIKSRRWSTAGDISRNCTAPAKGWLDPEHAPPNAKPVFPEQQIRQAISRKRKDHRILQYRKEKGALSPPRHD